MEVNAHSISSSFIYIFAFSHPAKQVMHCVKCKHGVVVPTEGISATTTPCSITTTTLCGLTYNHNLVLKGKQQHSVTTTTTTTSGLQRRLPPVVFGR